MARPGITAEQVNQAADELKGRGENPTIDKIRALIGGSPNTVHRHLKAWKATQPQARREAPQLPADLQAALVAEIDKAASAARAEAEADALDAQATADELATAGERLEEEAELLRERVEELEADRDRAQAVAQERKTEIDRLAEQVQREAQAAEAARLETATSRLKVEALTDQVTTLKTELSAALTSRDDAKEAATQAAQTAAVSEAREAAATQAAADLKADLAELKKELSQARKDASHAQGQTIKIQEQLNQEHEKNRQLAAELADAREALAKCEATDKPAPKKPVAKKTTTKNEGEA